MATAEDIIHSIKIDKMGITDDEAYYMAEMIRIVKTYGSSPETFRKMLVVMNKIENMARLPLLKKYEPQIDWDGR